MNSNDQDKKNDELELVEVKKSVKEDLFKFMSTIVQVVIAFDLSVLGNSNPSETTSNVTSIRSLSAATAPRLGLMRLASLELLDKLQ